jgi:hypothetical protein
MRGSLSGVGRVVVALAALVGLLWPLVAFSVQGQPSPPTDPTTVTTWRGDFRLGEDGTLRVVENLTTRMPAGRHGIFRYWDVQDPVDPHVRLVPHDIAVTAGGYPVPVELSWTNDRRILVARVGNPDVTLSPGRHDYRIAYAVEGAISPPSAGSAGLPAERGSDSAFYWNLIPQSSEMPIDRARLTVHLPARSGTARCAVGVGAQGGCTVSGEGTSTVTVSASSLQPRTPVTVRISLPVPPPERVTLPWTVSWDRVLGRSVPLVVVLVAVSAVALVVGWVLARQSKEIQPPYPVMYEPPAGLGPAQTAYLVTERVDPKDGLVSTLLYLAEKRLVRLSRTDDEYWVVEGTGDQASWNAVDAPSRSVAEALAVTRKGRRFRAENKPEAGETLKTAQKDLAHLTRAWARDSGLVVVDRAEAASRVALYAAAVLAVGCFVWNPFAATVVGLPAAAFVVGGFPLALGGVGTRRTARGRELWSRAGGFQRMLSTPSSVDRFDFSGRRELYTAYIPYAVAFHCADAWARKYETETGEPAPTPAWFYGGAYAGSFSQSAGLGSFQAALTASIAAYTASQSSSGGGGGGFSGGGGGGGGGAGSW